MELFRIINSYAREAVMISNIFSKRTKLDILVKQVGLVVKAMQKEGDQFWLGVFERHQETGSSLAKRFAKPEEIAAYARAVESVLGGMGSFNDAYYSRDWDALKEALYRATQDVLRECWLARGKPVHSILMSQILSVGAKVKLVRGAVISIGRDETEHYAPESRLEYRIMERIADDIDGMPRYRIRADSHDWLARHAALERA